MTAGGWIFMLSSVASVWALAIWCFWKVLKGDEHDEGRGDG